MAGDGVAPRRGPAVQYGSSVSLGDLNVTRRRKNLTFRCVPLKRTVKLSP